jgi:hypothetical protein
VERCQSNLTLRLFLRLTSLLMYLQQFCFSSCHFDYAHCKTNPGKCLRACYIATNWYATMSKSSANVNPFRCSSRYSQHFRLLSSYGRLKAFAEATPNENLSVKPGLLLKIGLQPDKSNSRMSQHLSRILEGRTFETSISQSNPARKSKYAVAAAVAMANALSL